MTEEQELTLLEGKETGKSWPHGEREFRPPLSPAMRALLEDHHNETFEKGRRAGWREAEAEFSINGLASLIVGAISGALVLWGFQAAWRWLTH